MKYNKLVDLKVWGSFEYLGKCSKNHVFALLLNLKPLKMSVCHYCFTLVFISVSWKYWHPHQFPQGGVGVGGICFHFFLKALHILDKYQKRLLQVIFFHHFDSLLTVRTFSSELFVPHNRLCRCFVYLFLHDLYLTLPLLECSESHCFLILLSTCMQNQKQMPDRLNHYKWQWLCLSAFFTSRIKGLWRLYCFVLREYFGKTKMALF